MHIIKIPVLEERQYSESHPCRLNNWNMALPQKSKHINIIGQLDI